MTNQTTDTKKAEKTMTLDSVSVQLQAKVDAKAPKKAGKPMEALLASMLLGGKGPPIGGVGFGGPAGASMLEAILGPRASGPFGPFGQR